MDSSFRFSDFSCGGGCFSSPLQGVRSRVRAISASPGSFLGLQWVVEVSAPPNYLAFRISPPIKWLSVPGWGLVISRNKHSIDLYLFVKHVLYSRYASFAPRKNLGLVTKLVGVACKSPDFFG